MKRKAIFFRAIALTALLLAVLSGTQAQKANASVNNIEQKPCSPIPSTLLIIIKT